jgi:CheY-like chemotaxis protein
MLRSLIREDVELVLSLTEDVRLVRVDQPQLERLILNLVVNGRDAIRVRGRIGVATGASEVRDGSALAAQLAPRANVARSVSDTGSGIAPEAWQHLFDPFFTTKEQGQGTGLGLSIVHGIVERFAGAVVVESEPGQGATFTVYIPSVVVEAAGAERTHADDEQRPPVRGGTETVLVVEDEPALRSLIELILSEAGYHVLAAADGEEALTLVSRGEPALDLVLTDAVMPKLSGPELVTRLREIRPDIRVIQMTGYSEHGFTEDELIAKPFEPETLLRRVRDLLDQS